MASCTTTIPLKRGNGLIPSRRCSSFNGRHARTTYWKNWSTRAGRSAQLPFTATTPYVNTILAEKEEKSPGNREIEHEIRSAIRWNAVAIILRVKRVPASIREITIGRIRNTKQRR